ncbi:MULTISPECIES: tripartite tricarboxylate transporter substrate binding protein [unclassified Achromobacter]|uniref:Bug family tripartite tricarboxylate transporter substrate binding protein n=1 Tax=unclassified Achromobacter TaxID=2626865 RepID=UPI000B5169C1|nr:MULTISPECIES: tripartite tricarboxylate transporter substrate binding protein [unclassified Achromobacter]OWT80660.1 MFS transporter [Achromobacter sp. HZ34]OWT81176.1 MFS transporter [Achromobacter sp. HZ28]
MNRREFARVAAAAACASALGPAFAQARYPDKPLTFVVPYPAGGAADQFARPFAQWLGDAVHQSVIIENRPGANGNIGSAYVARRMPADGYAFLLGSTSTLAINPHIYPSMGYSVLDDLQPVTLTHRMPNVLVVGANTPYHSVKDLIAAARQQPGKLEFGSAGIGNTMHMAAELFQLRASIRLLHIPYKGGPEALNDLLGGRIPMMFHNLPAIVPLVQAGKLRALAIADDKRSSLLPDVPTLQESGVPDATSVVWNGILVRHGTPAPIVAELASRMGAVLANPEFRRNLTAQGYEILSSTPAQFDALLRRDYAAMGDLVTRANIKME